MKKLTTNYDIFQNNTQNLEPIDPNDIDTNKLKNKEIYYKIVAKQNGKYYSIFDGKTEYEIGKIMQQKVRPGHRGGYYVFPTIDDAIFQDMYFF